MVKRRLPVWHAGMLTFLFPALLLLPLLHLHPAYEHGHGTDGTHKHLPVVHVDFLAVSAPNHGEHPKGHGVPGDNSSWPAAQIGLPTLLPRSPVPLLPILERAVGSLPVEAPVLSAPFLCHAWVLTRDHPPPVQDISFPSASPRSPPRSA